MKHCVIIGNGVAAAGCIEGIRSIDKDAKITVVSEEKHAVYCRPLISYYLENKTDLTRMNYRSEDFYEKTDCEVLYGRKAVKIVPAEKKVILDDGSKLEYSSLCVAAGSSPFIPSFSGLETVGNKFTFMTLDDCLALEKAVTPDSKVLIIGAGLIGLKCAEGLRDRAADITVCDLADRILSSILDAECASVMQERLESEGIKIVLNDTAVRFEKNTAFLKSGQKIDFDILVLAIGVRANTALVKDCGGEVNRGIIVNERMQMSLPDIFAAGDCTESEDISCGEKKVLALLPNAYMQGHTAGINMGGGSGVFDRAIPMNAIGFFGLHAMTAGSYTGKMYEEKSKGTLKRFFVQNGRLTGFILIGETERAGIYTSLIREKTPLDTVDFDILKKVATSFAFPREIRRKKFEGMV